MTDDPAKPPRFPFVAALLCAACLGAAVWTWMRFSYRWDVTVESLMDFRLRDFRRSCRHQDYFVSLRGLVVRTDLAYYNDVALPESVQYDTTFSQEDYAGTLVWVQGASDLSARATVLTRSPTAPRGSHATYTGRVVAYDNIRFLIVPSGGAAIALVDASASRFHPASIAGLVVGAMGVFVFTVALRHWLGQRRPHAARADDAPPGSEPRPE